MDRNGNGEELVLDNVFGPETSTPSFQNFDKDLFIGEFILKPKDL